MEIQRDKAPLVQVQRLPVFISGIRIKRLALRAKITTPILYGDPLDGAAAHRTRFTFLMSNLEIEMSCAQLALRANVGIHAGTFVANGCPKNFSDAMV